MQDTDPQNTRSPGLNDMNRKRYTWSPENLTPVMGNCLEKNFGESMD